MSGFAEPLLFASALGVATLVVPDSIVAMLLLWVALPYMAIVFAFKAPVLFRKINGADYSYGIYIYAFPIQQSVGLIGHQKGWSWLAELFIASGITLMLAGASWHCIEKPALSLKDLLVTSLGSQDQQKGEKIRISEKYVQAGQPDPW